MLVLVHVLIALFGLIVSGIAFIAPSRVKIKMSVALTFLTLASGSYLVISLHSNMISACISGLIYTLITGAGAIFGSRRLAIRSNI